MEITPAAEDFQVLLEGYAMTECPRWYDGRLYFSDMNGGAVYASTEQGAVTKLAEVEDRAGGLGWLPDGRLLVVAQEARRVLRLEAGALVVHADLSDLGTSPLNDMYVAPDGTAYVGDMGFDIHEFGRLMAAGEADRANALFRPAPIYAVAPDGAVRIAAEDCAFANGIIAGPGDGQVLVAESFALSLTLFRIADDGALVDRKQFAQLSFAPDGIALDADGHVWVADPTGRRVVRIAEGGEELASVDSDLIALSVALGGADLRTLFLCGADVTDPEESKRARGARIDALRVAVPGAS